MIAIIASPESDKDAAGVDRWLVAIEVIFVKRHFIFAVFDAASISSDAVIVIDTVLQFVESVVERVVVDRVEPSDVAAREDLVAIAARIEEIDRLAARDPVPCRPDVERHALAGDDVGRTIVAA